MHKIAAIVIALAMAGAATAQEEEETLFGSFEDPSFGGFGGPALKVTTLNGELGLLTGGRGGLIVDNTWLIGGGGYGLVTNVEGDYRDPATGAVPDLEFSYGGFELEYVARSNALVHDSYYLLLGGGSVAYRDQDRWGAFDRDEFFVAELAANLELNVTEYFRLALGAGYRACVGSDFGDLDFADLSGPEATLTFKFGYFQGVRPSDVRREIEELRRDSDRDDVYDEEEDDLEYDEPADNDDAGDDENTTEEDDGRDG